MHLEQSSPALPARVDASGADYIVKIRFSGGMWKYIVVNRKKGYSLPDEYLIESDAAALARALNDVVDLFARHCA